MAFSLASAVSWEFFTLVGTDGRQAVEVAAEIERRTHPAQDDPPHRFLRGDRAVLLTIRAQDRLGLALDRIHDRWFDVEAITYDSGARSVSIPFWSQPTQRPPINLVTGQREPFDDLLVVRDTDDPTIEDREQIGTYTFNDILVRGNQLLVRAEPNLRIICAIASFHITLGEDGA